MLSKAFFLGLTVASLLSITASAQYPLPQDRLRYDHALRGFQNSPDPSVNSQWEAQRRQNMEALQREEFAREQQRRQQQDWYYQQYRR